MKAVTAAFEAKFLPRQPTPEGHQVLASVKVAMSDLSGLVAEENAGTKMKWGMSWLDDIGIQETNPVNLTLFAVYWQDLQIATSSALKEIASIYRPQ